MSDEIKVQDETTEITIINNEEKFSVVDNEQTTTIIDNEEVFEVTEEIETITINASDLIVSSSTTADITLNCTATEQINDVVYLLSSNEARQANNGNISTAKAIGIIFQKTGDTVCKVRTSGLLTGLSGLDAGKEYFLDSSNGAMTTTPTTTSGSVLVRLGQALTATNFLINISNNRLIRR